jgi:uncharacterized protein
MTDRLGVNRAHLPRAIWSGIFLLSASILLSFWWPFQAEKLVPAAQSIVLVLLSFVCGYVDSSLGMGYGSTLTPLLLILGYRPLEVVPAIIASQFVAGGIGAWAHHLIGNVDLHPRNQAFRVACILASTSVLGTGVGAMVAVYLPALYLQAWVGLLVCFIGVVTLALNRRQTSFSWKRIVALGVFAAFNKGSTGGGYGPIVMGGQLVAGVSGKNAVGITTLAESLSCIVGVVTYLLAPGELSWRLAPFLIFGAVAAVPFSTITVAALRPNHLRTAIGILTFTLGLLILLKTFVF